MGGQDDGFSREIGEEKQPLGFTNTFCCLLVWYQLTGAKLTASKGSGRRKEGRK